MTINVDGLTRTLAHIEANPKDWNQAYFRCGTSFCFAGWFAVLDGAKLKKPDPVIPLWMASGWESLEDAALAYPDRDWERSEENVDHWLTCGETISFYAEQRLGLTKWQACELFDAENGVDDLRRIVARLVAEANAT